MVADAPGLTLDSASKNSLVEMLTLLRDRGSALLVVGNVPADVHRDVSRQMLGTDDVGVDRRVLALTADDSNAVSDRIPVIDLSSQSHETSVIAYRSSMRSTAATAPDVGAEVSMTHVDGSNLHTFLSEICREVERYEQTGTDDPASFRFCLDSLSTLLSEHDNQLVFRFLHLLIARIRAIRAIGHVHIQTERDSEHGTFVEPLFDAVVELRLDDRGRPQQRWHLTDHDVASRWLPFELDAT